VDRPQTDVINVNFIRLLSIQVFRQGFSISRDDRLVVVRRAERTERSASPIGGSKLGDAGRSHLVLSASFNERSISEAWIMLSSAIPRCSTLDARRSGLFRGAIAVKRIIS
jgi:hypothetical protein